MTPVGIRKPKPIFKTRTCNYKKWVFAFVCSRAAVVKVLANPWPILVFLIFHMASAQWLVQLYGHGPLLMVGEEGLNMRFLMAKAKADKFL